MTWRVDHVMEGSSCHGIGMPIEMQHCHVIVSLCLSTCTLCLSTGTLCLSTGTFLLGRCRACALVWIHRGVCEVYTKERGWRQTEQG